MDPCADEETVASPPVRERVPPRDVLTARHRHERRLIALDQMSENVLVGLHPQHLGRQATEVVKGKRREPVRSGVAVGADSRASNRRLSFESVAAIKSYDSSKSLRRDQHLKIVTRHQGSAALDQDAVDNAYTL
jgi:hypothetical protein